MKVWGHPKPAGSKRAIPLASGFNVTHADPKTKSWMQEVRSVAAAAIGDDPLVTGPVQLNAVFYFARPKGHYGSGRNAGKLKPSAPKYITKAPDLTKLVRAAEDALNKVLWKDDSQVCQYGNVVKKWSPDGREWMDLEVLELDEG